MWMVKQSQLSQNHLLTVPLLLYIILRLWKLLSLHTVLMAFFPMWPVISTEMLQTRVLKDNLIHFLMAGWQKWMSDILCCVVCLSQICINCGLLYNMDNINYITILSILINFDSLQIKSMPPKTLLLHFESRNSCFESRSDFPLKADQLNSFPLRNRP